MISVHISKAVYFIRYTILSQTGGIILDIRIYLLSTSQAGLDVNVVYGNLECGEERLSQRSGGVWALCDSMDEAAHVTCEIVVGEEVVNSIEALGSSPLSRQLLQNTSISSGISTWGFL